MDIERIDHYCDLFEQALKRGSQLSIEEFLEELSLPSDDRLRAELQRLDREYRQDRAVTCDPEPPAVNVDQATQSMPSEAIGAVVGSYKLLQKIGEGGMGEVYMAEQTEPISRRVALKIIKPGMDSKEVVARFEAERQALAMMDHSNIARVFDAGAKPAGRPYFVMELVKGIKITKYCDERHLTPKERLELFVPICQAVQHAHQKGIIHRDIKPSNVLIAQYDDQAIPKIIDFGVAQSVFGNVTDVHSPAVWRGRGLAVGP